MSLLELYGITPAPAITDTAEALVTTETGTTTTSLPVRRDPDCPHRKQVQTPCKHHVWTTLLWNEYAGCYEPIHCYDCVITINVCSEHQAPAAVVTPEPVACIEVSESATQAEQEVLSLDFELDATKDTLTAADYAMATPEQIAAWHAARQAIEQDTLIAELAFEADSQPDRERYFAARSGKYVLLHQRSDGLAVGCSCPSRVKKLRFQGKCCKHMAAHNDMLTPATKQQEAA